MVCQYKDICRCYGFKAKVFTQLEGNLECMIGMPDVIILFTSLASHMMAAIAKKKAISADIALIQSHSGSQNALKNILNATVKAAGGGGQ